MSESIRIHGTPQVVAAIPALLGFHPDDCLVAVFTDPGTGRVRCLARQDLNTPTEQISRVLIGTATRLPGCHLILAAYAASTGAWSAVEDRILSAVRDVQAADVTVLELLLVTEGRWWSLMCTNPDCCPPEGQPVPEGTSAVEVARVAAGHRAVAPSRTAAAARYTLQQPLPDTEVEQATQSVSARLQGRCHRAVQLLASTLNDHDAAQLVVLLQDVHVRDWVLAHLASTDIPDPVQLDVLITVALRAPEPLRPVLAGAGAAGLALAGHDPVGVWAMIDHAGDDSLAQLVADSQLACLPPEDLRAIFIQAGQQLLELMAEPAA